MSGGGEREGVRRMEGLSGGRRCVLHPLLRIPFDSVFDGVGVACGEDGIGGDGDAREKRNAISD
jgi:hypothetical protein